MIYDVKFDLKTNFVDDFIYSQPEYNTEIVLGLKNYAEKNEGKKSLLVTKKMVRRFIDNKSEKPNDDEHPNLENCKNILDSIEELLLSKDYIDLFSSIPNSNGIDKEKLNGYSKFTMELAALYAKEKNLIYATQKSNTKQIFYGYLNDNEDTFIFLLKSQPGDWRLTRTRKYFKDRL